MFLTLYENMRANSVGFAQVFNQVPRMQPVKNLRDRYLEFNWSIMLGDIPALYRSGNETSELIFIHQHPSRFKVIVLDDYVYEDAVVKNLSSQNMTSIPVLYPYELMNLSGLKSVAPFYEVHNTGPFSL